MNHVQQSPSSVKGRARREPQVDVSRTDLNLLAFFEVVLAEQHVGRAAARLDLSPSAVSHGLGRLRQVFHDPLFLRTPKGVVPTARALELAPAIADILGRVRSVLSTSEPFTPATSTRRFVVGAPDAVLAVLLPALLAELARSAPGIDLHFVHHLPGDALPALEARAVDLAVAPIDDIPARFVARTVYGEDFVIAARADHPFLEAPTLGRYCQMNHLVVGTTGDRGMVDIALEAKGRSRRVAAYAPNFMLALSALAETDLVSALPGSLAALHAERFGLAWVAPPLPLPHFEIHAVIPRSALLDTGLVWLRDAVDRAGKVVVAEGKAQPRRSKARPARRSQGRKIAGRK